MRRTIAGMKTPAPPSGPGPLAGLRIVEFAGIGPGPYAGMMLADMGADVIVIDRAAEVRAGNRPLFSQRGKRSLALDLKKQAALEVLWRLLDRAQRDGLAVGTFEDLVERRGIEEEVRSRLVAPVADGAHLVHQRAHRIHAIDHCRVDNLATPRALCLQQRADDAEDEEHAAAGHVAHQRGRDHRPLTRAARGGHRAAERDVVDVVPRGLG